MNKIHLALLFVGFLTSLPVNSEAQSINSGVTNRLERKMARSVSGRAARTSLSKVCATVKNVTGREFLYKSEISAHIPRGDARAAGPTLICNQVCPAKFPAALFYSNGELAAKLGYYGRWNETGRPRAYCAAGGAPACSNRTLSANSRARRRDGYLYLQTSRANTGRATVCYRVRPVGRTGQPK